MPHQLQKNILTDDEVEMRSEAEWRNHVANQLREGAARMDKLQQGLDANTAITTLVAEVLTACKTGFKVLGWIGIFVKWLGMIAGGVTAMYIAWKQFK